VESFATENRLGALYDGFLFLLNRRFQLLKLLCAVFLPSGGLSAQSPDSRESEPSLALPVLIFHTEGQPVLDRIRTPTHLTVLTPSPERAGGFVSEDLTGKAELSVRGNSSYYYPKKSYRLELQDENGKDRKAPLLGLPADSDWVLYASATDRTFARNLLAHELWRRMGHYAVRWRFVELFVVNNATPVASTKPERLAEEVARVLGAISVTNPSAASVTFSNTNNSLASDLSDCLTAVRPPGSMYRESQDMEDESNGMTPFAFIGSHSIDGLPPFSRGEGELCLELWVKSSSSTQLPPRSFDCFRQIVFLLD